MYYVDLKNIVFRDKKEIFKKYLLCICMILFIKLKILFDYFLEC